MLGGRLAIPWLLVLALGGTACDDISSFRGEFKLTIVKGNFVRSCFASDTGATLSFDPAHAAGDLPDDESRGKNWLHTTDGTFDHTPLELVRKLADDQLSLFDFPGPQRLRNYIMLARPTTGPLAGRDAFVVVSLLEDKKVEVRVIARTDDSSQACAIEGTDAGVGTFGAVDAGEPDGGASPRAESGPRQYFGIFRPSKS